jgi:Uma2 family endonuclease
MSATATPPTPTLTPPGGGRQPARYRWTLQAYRQLGKTGLFHDIKTILIDGEILVMALPEPPHNTSLGLAAEYLRTAFPTGHHVRNQMALDIGTENDPGPDLAVVPGSVRDYASRQATTAVLVVEISDSTLFFDTTTKAELYATAAVPEYWVIDLQNRRLLVFRDPVALPEGLGATAYRTHLTFDPADAVSPLAAPAATVRVADLLP